MRTHLTWSIEKKDGTCPHCGSKTVLVVAPAVWRANEGDEVEISEEISGHYCTMCKRLVSLSLNTGV